MLRFTIVQEGDDLSMYELIKQLYDELNQGSLTKAREITTVLIKKGMDKKFLAEVMKTIATEKMAQILWDEVAGALKK
jgi:hypothetical protein